MDADSRIGEHFHRDRRRRGPVTPAAARRRAVHADATGGSAAFGGRSVAASGEWGRRRSATWCRVLR